MHLLALGLNHTTAPVSVRERVAFSPEEAAATIRSLKERLAGASDGGLREAAVLSTCNRTELFCAAEDTDLAKKSLLGYLSEVKQVPVNELEPHIYTFADEKAAMHTFRVASGLDSMVLGETQIVGQMKKAVKLAAETHGLGTMLNRLFQSTFTVAKEVRTATEIGSNSVSLAAAAVRLALRLFGSLKDERVLFVGAGEMIELCAAHFAAQQPKSITIANRTLERGQTLARTVHAEAIRLADLPSQIARYDIIVSCTASALPIIGLGMIERAVEERRHRPMFIVDLAVPRDVEPEVDRLEDVYVYTVDDLGKVVQQGKASRQAAVTQAETIIGLRTRDFAQWLRQRESVPHIQALRERAAFLRDSELAKAKRLLKNGAEPEKALDYLARELTNTLLHDPTVLLRNAEGLSEEDRELMERVLERFYRRPPR
ncbi:MAG: Glutamyl-tRNA reductase [Burkholderia sp.]|jgi:glutamyl-tRNA reductase